MEEVLTAGSQPQFMGDVFNYGLPPSAPYVIQRDSIVTAPQTGGPFNATNPHIRFQISDSSGMAFMDRASVRIAFDLVNKEDATNGSDLTLLASGDLLFQRAQLYIRGTLVEDLFLYPRQCYTLSLLDGRDARADNDIEAPQTYVGYNGNVMTTTIAKGGALKRFVLPLQFGFLQASGMHYFGIGAISINLQLANQRDVFQGAAPTHGGWELNNVVIMSDIVRTTPDFANQYSQILMSGSRLLTSFQSCQTMQFQIAPANGTFSCSISRAFSRLKAVLLTFDLQPAPSNPDLYHAANNLYFPGGTQALDDSDAPLEIYAQFGTQTYPASVPMKGSQQFFYHLRRYMGYCRGNGNMSIYNRDKYLTNYFVTAITFEKARTSDDFGNGIAFSGVSSQSGELLRIYLRGLPATNPPTTMYVHLIHDEILESCADGVAVFV